MNIRSILADDMTALKAIIDANDLFPSDLLDDMVSDYLENKNSQALWFTCENSKPIAIAYCAPEKMTEGTWNLYLIAVLPDYQKQEISTSMLRHIEQVLTKSGERLLLVETSGLNGQSARILPPRL